MFAVVALCGLFVFQYFGLDVLHALVGRAFDAAAPLLVTYGLAMVLLALTNALTSYGIATHRLAFTVPLLICTLGTLAAIVASTRRWRRSSRSWSSAIAAAALAVAVSLILQRNTSGRRSTRLKRVLLIGGSGQLGTAIRQRWTDCEIVAPTHAELDSGQSAQLRECDRAVRPDVLVNAAAFHDVDRCEDEPERAFAINALAVGRSRALTRAIAARLFVTISTDYVFDGEATAPYAEDRAAASAFGLRRIETRGRISGANAPERGPSSFVPADFTAPATTNRRRQSFVERVLAQNADDAPLRVVDDVVASPTFAGDLADALARLIETEAYGLYHAVNVGPVSWYEFACEAIRQAGVARDGRADCGGAVEDRGPPARAFRRSRTRSSAAGHRDALLARGNCRVSPASVRYASWNCESIVAASIAAESSPAKSPTRSRHFIAAHSTVSVERSVLRLLGVDGVTLRRGSAAQRDRRFALAG